MDYIIEKSTITDMGIEPIEREVFVFKYAKKGIEMGTGKEVEVEDENRTEQFTAEQLEQQKLSHQNAIKEIDAKIAAIGKLI